MRSERSRELAMARVRAPLLGRDAELARLRAAFAGERDGCLVVVAPPGVGKSRLVAEFADECDGVVYRARLRPDVLAPFEPVAQLLLSALGDDGESSLRTRLHAGEVAPARAAVLVEHASALLRSNWDEVGESDRGTRFAAWLEALEALARPRRNLWIVEDAHWAGGDLLAFLESAGDANGDRLVLVTARPSLLETAPAWCASATVLHLPALEPADTSALVRALVGDAVPTQLVGRIAERSDGNPLFVEELVRTWVAVGVLVEQNGGWALSRPAEDVSVPSTVHALYAAQLDDLPDQAREVARRAAVAGRHFPHASLEPLGVPEAEAGIDVLSRRALVSGPRPDPSFGPTYSYRHALLRDAGYASLARAERALLHARLAAWLEQMPAPAPVAEPVARHYARALESTPALARDVAPGLDRAECRRLAAAWFERAAEAALDVSAYVSARELFERSLELTAEDDMEARARRLTSLGDVTAATAGMDEGADELEEALELAREAGARREVARAAAALSRLRDRQVQFEQAARIADDAIAEIGEREDEETALLLLRRAEAVNDGSDETTGPAEDAERALAIARTIEHRRLELEALDLLASIQVDEGSRWEEIEELALELRMWTVAAEAIRLQAGRLAADHADQALPLALRAVEFSESRGLRESLAWSQYTGVEIGLVSGAWDDALARARRALDIGISNGYDRAVVRTWSAVLPIASARRDRSLCEEAQLWFEHRFREPERPSPYARILQAAAHLRLAHNGLREPFVPEVEERLESFGLPYTHPSWFASLEAVFDAWLDAGELDGAAGALERMEPAASSPSAPRLARGVNALLLAKLNVERGEDPEPEAEHALADFHVARAPWWIAKALRLVGRPDAQREARGLESALGLPDVE